MESEAATERIEIEGVRHVYRGGTVALDGIDLSIDRGLFGLLGPNGAGKSTLMRIVCTLLVPTEGRVRVRGCDVVAERERVRRWLGYLPQEFGAWRLARVREVLDTLARLSGLHDRKQRARRVERTLEDVGLAGGADLKVKQLSGGMLRRLGVAQALVHDPWLLVVDEPTVGLDPGERVRFRELMTHLARERAIILSTHIVADLGAACRRLAILDRGRIVYDGSMEGLLGRARGRVFELERPAGRPADLPGGWQEISRRSADGRVLVRAVGTGAPPAGARPVEEPGPEEAYLAFMAERGRSTGELEAGEEN